MKRPSFQFYPADWKSNTNLRRCSKGARGVWMDIMCALHDSDEYGILRWPLKDIAIVAGATLTELRELVQKGVLKGSDAQFDQEFIYTPRSGRKDGQPVTLVGAQPGPVWFSSRMVKDEYIRTIRGESTRFEDSSKGSPNKSPKGGIGAGKGDGSSSSSPSSSSPSGEREKSAPARKESNPKNSGPIEFPDFPPQGPPPPLPKGKVGAPAPPSDDWSEVEPTGATGMGALETWINSLHPKWTQRPHFSRVEREELLANSRIFFDLTDRDKELLARYMDAAIDPEWGKFWQPDQRGQLVKSVLDVLGHADRWERECRKRKVPTGLEVAGGVA